MKVRAKRLLFFIILRLSQSSTSSKLFHPSSSKDYMYTGVLILNSPPLRSKSWNLVWGEFNFYKISQNLFGGNLIFTEILSSKIVDFEPLFGRFRPENSKKGPIFSARFARREFNFYKNFQNLFGGGSMLFFLMSNRSNRSNTFK